MSLPDGPKRDRTEPREWPTTSRDLWHELQLMGGVSQLSPWRRRGGTPSRRRSYHLSTPLRVFGSENSGQNI